MGQYAVILGLSAVVVIIVLMLTMREATSGADEGLNYYHHEELARDAALTGLHMTVRKLAADTQPGSWTTGSVYEIATTTHDNGATFRTDVSPCNPASPPYPGDTCVDMASNPQIEFGDVVDVRAVGSSGTRFNAETNTYDPIKVIIHARYMRKFDDGGIPPNFRNVINVNELLLLQGNSAVFAINDSINASVHTNGDLDRRGGTFLVEGYGTYTGNNLLSPSDTVNFIPNIDYNGSDPNVFWSDSVHIPVMDLDNLRTLAQTSGALVDDPDDLPIVIDGDGLPTPGVLDFTNPATWPFRDADGNPLYLAGPCQSSGQCGTEDNPFIMVVEEPISFLNTTHVKGYGIIATAQTINIAAQGSGGGLYGDLTAEDRTKLLVATMTNMNIGHAGGNTCLGLGPQNQFGNDGHTYPNNSCASASGDFEAGVTLYAFGDADLQGSPYIVGGLSANDSSHQGGSPMLIYGSPSKTIIDPGFEFIIPIGPILIAYSEW